MNLRYKHTQEAVCPNCLDEKRDSWEFNDNDEYECDCGCVFGIKREVSVTYSTWEVRMYHEHSIDNKLTEEIAQNNIQCYIDKCYYTYKVEDIVNEYKYKYLKKSYVSFTMEDVILNCKKELEFLIGR